MTTLAVIREVRRGERRVAVVPAEIPKVTAAGVQVVVESGRRRSDPGSTTRPTPSLDGVRIVERRSDALDAAEIVVAVSPPTAEEAGPCRSSPPCSASCRRPPTWTPSPCCGTGT